MWKGGGGYIYITYLNITIIIVVYDPHINFLTIASKMNFIYTPYHETE